MWVKNWFLTSIASFMLFLISWIFCFFSLWKTKQIALEILSFVANNNFFPKRLSLYLTKVNRELEQQSNKTFKLKFGHHGPTVLFLVKRKSLKWNNYSKTKCKAFCFCCISASGFQCEMCCVEINFSWISSSAWR